MALSFDDICRTCMTQSPALMCIFGSEDSKTNIVSMLSSITSIQADENDGLPDSVCFACLSEINRAFSFKSRSEHIDRMFRQYVNETSSDAVLSSDYNKDSMTMRPTNETIPKNPKHKSFNRIVETDGQEDIVAELDTMESRTKSFEMQLKEIDEEKMNKIINLMFEMAIVKSNSLEKTSKHFKTISEKCQIFKKKLIEKCQKEFNRILEIEKSDVELKLQPALTETQYQANTENIKRKVNPRSLAVFRFIGELANIEIVSMSDVKGFVNLLLDNFSDKNLEYLCILLKPIRGAHFSGAIYGSRDTYFQRLNAIIKKKNLTFKVSDRVFLMKEDLMSGGVSSTKMDEMSSRMHDWKFKTEKMAGDINSIQLFVGDDDSARLSEFNQKLKSLLINFTNKDEAKLKTLANSLFSMAISESKYAEKFTDLIETISIKFINGAMFRRLLLDECQQHFQMIVNMGRDTEAKNVFETKEHSIGIVSLIGELFNHGMFKRNQMQNYILQLYRCEADNKYELLRQLYSIICPKFFSTEWIRFDGSQAEKNFISFITIVEKIVESDVTFGIDKEAE